MLRHHHGSLAATIAAASSVAPACCGRSEAAVRAAARLARDHYAAVGVDVDLAFTLLSQMPVSLHCWQGDDVRGCEEAGNEPGGGLAVTGSHPGRARDAEELRSDLDAAMSLLPGRHRVNLHAFYGDYGSQGVDRDAIDASHFNAWIDWARDRKIGIDFNPTCFAHPLATDGFTLSHSDASIRRFWIAHCQRCREIGAVFGAALGTPCVTNVWIPDGYKDTPADRSGPRERLAEALDLVFRTALPPEHHLDAVEPKLFGIGSESYTVGSAEFYLGYCITRQKMLCLDAGHFHPTESIADKISSVLLYLPRILLHVSRGVRWDSDHVVTFTDDLVAIGREIIAVGDTARIHVGLDYFDASINRIAAWAIGSRNMLKALLLALLEPPAIRAAERAGDLTARLTLQEEARSMPYGVIWDEYCLLHGAPVGAEWLEQVRRYEREVTGRRR